MNLKMLDPRLWATVIARPRLLNVGETAPPFTATAHDGTTVRLEDFADRKVILYFYPAADTPGCTRQGCGFRDRIHDFVESGIEILGVSFDSVEDNRKFAEKYRYPFKLLSDTSRAIGVAYGAADSNDTAYATRIAYLIDHGKITHVYNVRNVYGHAEQVLRDAKG